MKLLQTFTPRPGSWRCGQLVASVHQIAEALGRAVDAKDKRLFEHSSLTADLASVIALAHGLSAKQADVIHIAGHLHDIGKIGVPDAVLLKPGRLTETEWALMREHPRIGAEILNPVELFGPGSGVAEMVLAHHEDFDGGGYPRGLAGRDIPMGGRILAVADSLAAMLEDRSYRVSLSLEAALEEIDRYAGSRYDPDICRDALSHAGRIAEVVRGKGEIRPAGAEKSLVRQVLVPHSEELLAG